MTRQQFDTDEQRWKAVVDNDTGADNIFYYAVITTGVYCLPSCTSRLPNRENVEFFTARNKAEAAGYRPCKRCRPAAMSRDEEVQNKIIQACRILDKSEVSIKLADLAAQVDLSPYHFHRLFKKTVGITPKQYGSANRARRFQADLKTSPSITEAIYSAGFGSSSSAYDKNLDQLAMQPKAYRKGAVGVTIFYGLASCYLGWVIVGATERGICAIEFGDTEESLVARLAERFPKAKLQKGDREFDTLLAEVIAFIEAPKKTFRLPLDIQGTSFQRRVWDVLREIKPGETLSYSDVAQRIGSPTAVRAVASACGANRLAVAVPCHRVISKGGKTGGYRWGTNRKKRLLEAESKENP